jgi:membrane protein YqaA with SNARE-associated domain
MMEKNEQAINSQLSGSWLEWVYFKILNSCGHASAPWILALLSFTESCCFIIPPEVILFPMSYAQRKKAWLYGAITTITSVMGAVAGYYLGALLWTEIQPYAFSYIPGFEANFEKVGQMYKENAISALFISAFTPIPFKVFTVSAGIYADRIGLLTLIGTSLVGRGARYFIMVGLIYFLGDKAKELIEKHFKIFSIVLAVLAIALFVLLKLRH